MKLLYKTEIEIKKTKKVIFLMIQDKKKKN